MFKTKKEYLDYMDQQLELEDIKTEAKLNVVSFENPYREYDAVIPVKGITEYAEALAIRSDREEEDDVLLWRLCVKYCSGFTRKICKGFYSSGELENEIYLLMHHILYNKPSKWKDGYFLMTVLLLYRNKHTRVYGKKEKLRAFSEEFYIVNVERGETEHPETYFEETHHLEEALKYIRKNYEPLYYELLKYKLEGGLSGTAIAKKLGVTRDSYERIFKAFKNKITRDRILYKYFIKCDM